ncbi:MAG: hypothetical protein AB7T19_15410 [Planctomycetota bacterium]
MSLRHHAVSIRSLAVQKIGAVSTQIGDKPEADRLYRTLQNG